MIKLQKNIKLDGNLEVNLVHNKNVSVSHLEVHLAPMETNMNLSIDFNREWVRPQVRFLVLHTRLPATGKSWVDFNINDFVPQTYKRGKKSQLTHSWTTEPCSYPAVNQHGCNCNQWSFCWFPPGEHWIIQPPKKHTDFQTKLSVKEASLRNKLPRDIMGIKVWKNPTSSSSSKMLFHFNFHFTHEHWYHFLTALSQLREVRD